MKEKFLCVMAEYDIETNQRLEEIQKLLSDNGFVGKQTKNLPNHITLGTFPTENEECLVQKIKEIDFSSFNIRLNNIGLFGLNVLFIAPAVNNELLNLQEQFNDNYADGMEWTAHTTMLIDEPETIQRALPIVADKFKSFAGRVESISLYEFWPSRLILKEDFQGRNGFEPAH